jgi:hypothetical protein
MAIFVVAASDSWNIRVKPQSADRIKSRPPNALLKTPNNHSVDNSFWHFDQISLKGCYLVIFWGFLLSALMGTIEQVLGRFPTPGLAQTWVEVCY